MRDAAPTEAWFVLRTQSYRVVVVVKALHLDWKEMLD
jgi:hypothetical protein